MNSYISDNISAIDAKFEAQKLAFAPVAFHVAKALVDLNILDCIAKHRKVGLNSEAIAKETKLSSYAVNVLLEFGLSLNIVKLIPDSNPEKYSLGKIGYFLNSDPMTKANMDFIADVCYLGLNHLQESLIKGKPEGLKVFGAWETIYQGLSKLPKKAQDSWFAFDHFYSDAIFQYALPLVFEEGPKHIMDIGSNTGKFTQAVLEYSPIAEVTMVDLEPQINLAQQNKELFPQFQERIHCFPTNILQDSCLLPHAVDAVWMSQFLDCFHLDEIKKIMQRIHKSIKTNTPIFILEPLWDKQNYPAAAYSLQATSLYFTAMANGNSKMYTYSQLKNAIESAGYALIKEYHHLGEQDYSLLKFMAV